MTKELTILLVGGECGQKPRPSIFVDALFVAIKCEFPDSQVSCLNGATLDHLDIFHRDEVRTADILFWMPNIDNKQDKYLPNLKKINPKMLLIVSKRLDGRDLTAGDLIGRMLKYKVNLTLAMYKDRSPMFKFHNEVLDPLGNSYYAGHSIHPCLEALLDRVKFLSEAVRVKSVELAHNGAPKYVDDGFLKIVKEFGVRFSQFVEQVNPNRLLGNASTRCSFGFPSVRDVDCTFVSKRNVDKETLSEESMVPVFNLVGNELSYCGCNKPSVDSPIQVELYKKYPHINYIVHGHCYISGAFMTKNPVSCGDLREVEEVVTAIGEPTEYQLIHGVRVNLKGHGCLIMANNLDYFKGIKLVARPYLETH